MLDVVYVAAGDGVHVSVPAQDECTSVGEVSVTGARGLGAGNCAASPRTCLPCSLRLSQL